MLSISSILLFVRTRKKYLKSHSSVARCTEIPEKLQNAFAAMAGSGPAYIYQVHWLSTYFDDDCAGRLVGAAEVQDVHVNLVTFV